MKLSFTEMWPLIKDRVLDVLETVNVLFTQSPYIVILAIDDNIIVKAVDRNLNQRAQLEINGRDYLRNMIHLPFYMQDQPWVSMIYSEVPF